MSAPINFLTASGEELRQAYLASDRHDAYVFIRDQTATAAEAKVRGESERRIADAEAAMHVYRRNGEEWKARAIVALAGGTDQ